MPGLELFIFGLTAALMGSSPPSSPTFAPSERKATKTVSAVDNLFLAHRHSFFNDPLSNGAKGRTSNALTSLSFDDQVEDLMDNPW